MSVLPEGKPGRFPRPGGGDPKLGRREPDVQTVVPLPGKGVEKPQPVQDHEERKR